MNQNEEYTEITLLQVRKRSRLKNLKIDKEIIIILLQGFQEVISTKISLWKKRVLLILNNEM